MGGALEADESVSDALVRELREETGLTATSVELFGVFSDPSRRVGYDDGNVYRVLAIAFRVDVSDGPAITSAESVELRFVSREDLEELDLTPAHRPLVERYLARPASVVVE